MADDVTYKFEKYLIGGQYKYRYIGETIPGMDDDSPRWTIYQLTWGVLPDSTVGLQEIRTLNGKAWSNRASLDW